MKGLYFVRRPRKQLWIFFAPDILSTDKNEFNAAFTPNGEQVYFTVNTDSDQYIMKEHEKENRSIQKFILLNKNNVKSSL